MAMTIQGGGFRGKRQTAPAISEINVTPFVDVVLVLLIIFMLTAHVMEYGIEVEVPKTKTVETSVKEQPVLTIGKTGEVSLNRDTININLLAQEIRQRFPNATGVYVRADKETPWDPIAQVLGTLHEAKIAVNMVTQPQESGKP